MVILSPPEIVSTALRLPGLTESLAHRVRPSATPTLALPDACSRSPRDFRSLIRQLIVRTSRSTGAVQGMFALLTSTIISVLEVPSVTSSSLVDSEPETSCLVP